MPLCTTILDKWLYVCRRSTSKGLLAAFLCLSNGRCNAAIAHFARTAVFLKNMRLSPPERLFFSKICDCQPPNSCFSQKHAIVNPRTIVFLKNMRLSPPERLFFLKTCDCQPPNNCFSQKRAIVNPRTIVFLKNMRLSTPERLFFSKTCDCQPPNGSPQRCNSSYCPPNRLLQGATAHIDPRIDCCKAQQLILTPESTVAMM